MGKLQNVFNALLKPEPVGTSRRIYGFQNEEGTRVTEDSCMESSSFYRGVTYLSGQLAKLPCEIKDKDNNVLDNDLSYLLNVSPNGETTAFKFKLWLIQCAIIVGNGYAEIQRDYAGRVVALWPLRPDRIYPVRAQNGDLLYEVTQGGLYGDTVYLRPRDIYHLPNIHMVDAISGQSVIAYMEQTLGISIGADKFANSLFTNGGLPSGVLTATGTMSDEAYNRLKTSWKTQHGGKKTGSTAILEGGVTYSPISHSPDVLQFLESRRFSVTETARFLGVPPQKLFDTDSAKYSNMEQAQLEVMTDTLDTWARNMEGEGDLKLLNGRRGGTRCEVDIYSVTRGDSASRATYFQKMQQAGAMTPNEIRKKEGLPKSLDVAADKLYLATNNLTPMDRIDEVIDANIAPKTSEAPKNKPSVPEDENPEAAALTKAALEYLRK